jgi:hypothetical protein
MLIDTGTATMPEQVRRNVAALDVLHRLEQDDGVVQRLRAIGTPPEGEGA